MSLLPGSCNPPAILGCPFPQNTKPCQNSISLYILGPLPGMFFRVKRYSPSYDYTMIYVSILQIFVCVSQQTVENSLRDGNTRPPYLPPEKSVCRSRSNS